MDNPIGALDKTALYPAGGPVKPAAESEKEKDRKFADALKREEEDGKKKKHRQDTVTIQAVESESAEEPVEEAAPPETSEPDKDPKHVDLRA